MQLLDKKVRFHKNVGPFSLRDIAERIGANIYLNNNLVDTKKELPIITNVAGLKTATEGTITFLDSQKNQQQFMSTNASACIVDQNTKSDNQHIFLLVTENPYASYLKVAKMFYPEDLEVKQEISRISTTAIIGKDTQISPHCYIGEHAQIGNNVKILANAYIGDNVVIGDNCVVHSNAVITNSIIGNNSIINSGAVVGKPGFGYVTENGKHIKIPHLGRVIIGNDVEIGANTCIDRGTLEDTVIGDMCKLDNLVQIGHNVKLGTGCLIVSQVGISGSTTLGNYVAVGGQAGLAGHLSVGDQSKIAAQSGVIGDVPPESTLLGFPAQPVKEYWKQIATLKKLTSTKGTK